MVRDPDEVVLFLTLDDRTMSILRSEIICVVEMGNSTCFLYCRGQESEYARVKGTYDDIHTLVWGPRVS